MNRFYAFKIDENGVNPTPVISTINPIVPITGYRRNAIGYLKASPDGKKIAIAHNQLGTETGGTENNGATYLYDFNNETGNIAFRATFPNPKGLLRFGETGNVVITTPIKDAMLIPQKATYEVLDKKYVYVITKDNVVKAREIAIEAELPHLFVVKSGLEKTDRILLEGLRMVKENEKIEVNFQDPNKVMNSLELYAE